MRLLFVCALALAACAAGCGGGGAGTANDTNSGGANSASTTGKSSSSGGASSSSASSHPGTDAGAEALLKEFLKPGADYAALTKQLRPTKADYEAVFEPDLAASADAVYTPAWDGGAMVIAPKEGQTELKLSSATSEELKSWTGGAAEFPGGYKEVAAKLKPGLKLYRFKFVKPGEDLGMAFDGLSHVNGHWRIFPKPWRLQGTN